MCDNHKSEKYAKKEKENIKLGILANSEKKIKITFNYSMTCQSYNFFFFVIFMEALGGVYGGGVEGTGMLSPPPRTASSTLFSCQRFQYIIHYCTLRVSIILLYPVNSEG